MSQGIIAIVDYGMGNLHSVSKAVERLGYEALVTSDREAILGASGVILPGVGAFGDAMEQLRRTELDAAVKAYAATGRPLLGICLGMQLLFSESEEHGRHRGLDLLPGSVRRLDVGLKIPHMGWNRLRPEREDPILEGIGDGYAYFVHSYHVIPGRREDVLATTDYGTTVTAVVGRGRLYGMQFHPEKSGADGMRLLGNFLRLTGEE